MKILQVGFSSNPGGVENVIINYYRNIDKNEIQFDFLDMYDEGIAFSDEIENYGGKIISIGNYKRNPISAYLKLISLIKKNNYDVVHIHMQSAANILPVVASLVCKCKTICHSHSSSTPKGIARKIMHEINKKIIRKMNVYKWACGEKAGKWMWGDEFDENNIIVNAIDSEKFIQNSLVREKIRNKCGFSSNDKVIGFIGRFGEEKNVFFLIDILEELIKMDDNYKLLTVGGNELYDKFYDSICRKGLKNHYYSAGIQRVAIDWYKAMDAFLLPSYFEGFPMVALEAQATGLPCFLSERISKEIDVTKSITFLSLDDASVWAEAIISYKKDNINTFPMKYMITNATDKLTELYKEIKEGN